MLLSVVRNSLARQFSILVAAQGFGIALSLALTIMMTRNLDVADYGAFRYATTFLALALTVLHFGWPYSAARLLALERERSVQQEIIGACAMIVFGSTAIGVVATLLIFSVATALGWQLPTILIYVAPFFYVTLGPYMIGNICQGLNRIGLLSMQYVLPYLLLLPVTAIQVFVLDAYSYRAALLTYLTCFSIVVAAGFLSLGVSFKKTRAWVAAIAAENRGTGFPIYVGGLFGVASAQMVAIWVAEFVEPSHYGHYALALAVSGPLSVVVSSVGTVTFRSSSGSESLSARVLTSSFALGVVLVGVFFVAMKFLLTRVFGNQYEPSIPMAQAMALGGVLIGWGDIFQRFLGSHGQGTALGGAAVLTGTVAILSAALLVPRWNVYGAIVSAILAGVVYLGSMVVLYLRHTMRQNGQLQVLDPTM